MTAATVAQRERAALCDLMLELGPDAPTLCEGWTTADLAAHLVVRERRPDSAPGIFVPQLAGWTERVMAGEKARGLEAMVATLRDGPPPPMSWIDTQVNTQEMVIHHEDVRRANGMGPREDVPDVQRAVAVVVRRGAKLYARRMGGTGLVLVLEDGSTIDARRGDPTAVMAGPPVEQLLFLSGRGEHADVVIEGVTSAVEKLRSTRFGI